jgi:hypothetical protein
MEKQPRKTSLILAPAGEQYVNLAKEGEYLVPRQS